MKKLVIACMLVCCFGAVVIGYDYPESAYENGKATWEQWDRQRKLDFVTGFASAFYSMVLKLYHDLEGAEWYVEDMHNMLAGLTVGQVVDGVDVIYRTGKYDEVPISGIIFNLRPLVREELREEEKNNGDSYKEDSSEEDWYGFDG
jgi:hypothetical protein